MFVDNEHLVKLSPVTSSFYFTAFFSPFFYYRHTPVIFLSLCIERQEPCFWIEVFYIGKCAVLLQCYLLRNISALEEIKTRVLTSEGSSWWEVICQIQYKRLLSGFTFIWGKSGNDMLLVTTKLNYFILVFFSQGTW